MLGNQLSVILTNRSANVNNTKRSNSFNCARLIYNIGLVYRCIIYIAYTLQVAVDLDKPLE